MYLLNALSFIYQITEVDAAYLIAGLKNSDNEEQSLGFNYDAESNIISGHSSPIKSLSTRDSLFDELQQCAKQTMLIGVKLIFIKYFTKNNKRNKILYCLLRQNYSST